ncbi:putative 3-hydroxyacyl-CoA dehydrogenase [Pusillimonas sp. T7-7]|uniref:3-hydroxyacyl-CoA dehydrogenase NAD-binding domain-containing protein n=1 Tax=Pusillimonas sp. (strain T7-7) TaxID=1007105 RepID=UPI000208505A|nr:3-hydroxyacyl-CoA dehydrogenase NAD-binding domain-containing protein [Pusillimonas sp. T7-7]AEC20128.1 putative 3-hydroxyacyl-CoA dehydrogenase [Pusillimonas sp. T7-7]
MNNSSKKIAVVGTGVIGASWAACFLANGFDVAATDPAPGAQARLKQLVETYWPTLERMGLAEGASPARLSFHEDLGTAVEGAMLVQENGPERIDIKRETMAQISAAAAADTLIATSSSGIPVSQIQDAAQHPERVLIGHPFNPPHLIPLVEVVGGRLTSPEAIQKAMDFYLSIGKKPIHIRREVKGHVANRLQAALWREAFHLVEEGVASVSDIDTAIAHGPGLRWALLGPFLNLHLSGGAGGISHLLDHLGPPIEEWWADLGQVRLNPELNKQLIDGVDQELGTSDLGNMVAQRDDLLLALLKLKASADKLP